MARGSGLLHELRRRRIPDVHQHQRGPAVRCSDWKACSLGGLGTADWNDASWLHSMPSPACAVKESAAQFVLHSINSCCLISNCRLYPEGVTHETLDAAAAPLPAEAIDAIERAATSAHLGPSARGAVLGARRQHQTIRRPRRLRHLPAPGPRLPRRRQPLPAVPAPGAAGRDGRRHHRRGRPDRPAVRRRPGHRGTAHADLRGHGGRRNPGRPAAERGDHRGLPVGPGRGHQGLLQPGRRGAGGESHLRGGPEHVRGLPGPGGHRGDGRRRPGA